MSFSNSFFKKLNNPLCERFNHSSHILLFCCDYIYYTLITIDRENVEALIKKLNGQKHAINKNRFSVDGRHFKI